jgi:hypothetical protein
MAEIGLADAIAVVRQELATAMERGAGADLQFPVDGVELEFQVGVTTEGQTGGKARFWVLEWGAEASRSREATHRVTVSLGPPVDLAGNVVKVTQRSLGRP